MNVDLQFLRVDSLRKLTLFTFAARKFWLINTFAQILTNTRIYISRII